MVDSLLEAISRLEGDALIMHVGEKPYVVTTSASMNAYRGPLAWGHVELSSRILTTEVVVAMLAQLLPADQRLALDEYGAVEYELPTTNVPSDRFTIVAARGGDDVWLEVRRTPAVLPAVEVVEQAPSEPLAASVDATLEEGSSQPAETGQVGSGAPTGVETSADTANELEARAEFSDKVVGGVEASEQGDATALPAAEARATAEPEAATLETPQEVVARPAPTRVERTAEPSTQASATAEPLNPTAIRAEPPHEAEGSAATQREAEARAEAPSHAEVTADVSGQSEPSADAVTQAEARADASTEVEPQIVPSRAEVDALLTATAAALLGVESPAAEPRQAIVFPLSRSPITAEPVAEVRAASGTPLDRILRIAAARGAATVYVVARSQPMIRVDGEISVLDSEPALTAAEVERFVMDLAPARGRDAMQPTTAEWMADVPDVGRVRCVTFRDHRGPGVIFRMIPPKAISADQLGLAPEVQALCAQPDGLVLVTGARASGKSTLLTAFVDLINRTRSDHVITIESQIGFVHEGRRSFISQREVRGDGETAAGAVRSAFREDPDVLVIEDMRTFEIVAAAFEAAESGRLVFGSLSAPSTVAALDRLIEMFPVDRRAQAQTSLSGALRGVVAQTLLRKVRGGRIAAREILLNTPAVASLILEGKTFQLPVALDSGRRHGMIPLGDSLADLVREGTVHAAEAYRKAPDREALLAALRRDGIDTSFAERLA